VLRVLRYKPKQVGGQLAALNPRPLHRARGGPKPRVDHGEGKPGSSGARGRVGGDAKGSWLRLKVGHALRDVWGPTTALTMDHGSTQGREVAGTLPTRPDP